MIEFIRIISCEVLGERPGEIAVLSLFSRVKKQHQKFAFTFVDFFFPQNKYLGILKARRTRTFPFNMFGNQMQTSLPQTWHFCIRFQSILHTEPLLARGWRTRRRRSRRRGAAEGRGAAEDEVGVGKGGREGGAGVWLGEVARGGGRRPLPWGPW